VLGLAGGQVEGSKRSIGAVGTRIGICVTQATAAESPSSSSSDATSRADSEARPGCYQPGSEASNTIEAEQAGTS
jgi:hypothetical protein